MSLPAPAVPCLLPSSPQPSHAHAHPLQIFFPFEITQKLLQNKAISVKILFLGHSRNEIDSAKISRPSTSHQRTNNTHTSDKQNRPNPATLHFRQSRPLFFPREQNHLFKIPFLSFSIPSSSMSLPAPAVPCLLPSSPQPSHAHAHPLQIFFPSEITQKLLQNKAISVKILFLGHS